MAVRHYKRLTLTSADSSLEALAISKVNGPLTQYYDLQHGDTARVDFSMDDPTYPSTSMDFIFDSAGTDANNAPRVIRPIDYNTDGPGVWRLIKSRVVHLTADTLELTDSSQGVVMTPAERTKLSGVEDSANNYVHPADHDDMYYNETEMNGFLAGKEPVFLKNTAFNKNFGSAADTVCEGSDSRLSDARTPLAHDHDASAITSGTIDIARLPQGALERLVHVTDEAARFALTTGNVQNGDTVQQDDTAEMWRVVDDTNLNNASGYTAYTAGAASSVPWTGVTGKPSTYPADPHNHDDVYYTEPEMDGFLGNKEDAFSKNTAFNKDFGTAADTVCQGDDTRLADDRFPTAHDLAGAEHNAATLAELNLKISDATLIDTTDERLVNDRTPLSHGNEKHDAVFITATEAPVQTVAGKSGNVELVPADAGAEPAFTKNTAFNKDFGSATATVCEGDDARLSDDRYPTAHESSHITGGADEIPGAVASVSSGLLSAADKAKLDGISEGAVSSIAWGEIVNQPENQQIYNNLLDASVWEEGTQGNQGMFLAVGVAAANEIVMGLGPDGAIVDLWKCTPQDATTEDGGWSDSRITIDNTKTYRFVAFVKRVTTAEGTIDFGIVDNAGSDTDIEVYTAGGSTLVPAPDFKSAFDPPTLDKWYMLVGYVFGTAYAGAQQNLGGVYDCATGAKIASCTDYQWGPSANQTGSKVLYNNSTDSSTALAYFYGPRIDMVSGMEPSLKALIPNPVAVNAESLGGALPSAYATLAGTNTFTGANTFSNAAPQIILKETDATDPLDYVQIQMSNSAYSVYYSDNSATSFIQAIRFDPATHALTTQDGTIYHTGNDSNLAKLNGTQTFSGVNTFAAAPVLNSTLLLKGKETGGIERELIGVSVSNNVIVGDGNSPLYLRSNGTFQVWDGVAFRTVWTSGNDGLGSALDAGLLGGDLPSAYATLAGTQTFSGAKTFSANMYLTSSSGDCLFLRSPTASSNLYIDAKTTSDYSQVIFQAASIGKGKISYDHDATPALESIAFYVGGTSNLVMSINGDGTVDIGGNTIYHTGNDSNLAKLDGTQTFSGVNTFTQPVTLGSDTGGSAIIQRAASGYAAVINVYRAGILVWSLKDNGTAPWIEHQTLYVGKNGGSDSKIAFYDDNSDVFRTIRWSDSNNDWYVEDSTATQRKLYHEGNSANLAKLDGTQTFSGANTFSSPIVLNNDKFVTAKDTGGTARNLAGLSSSDVFQFGGTAYPVNINSNGTTTINGNTVYHTGNDSNLAKLDGNNAFTGDYNQYSGLSILKAQNDLVPSGANAMIYATDGAAGGIRPSSGNHLVIQSRSTALRDIIFAVGTTPTERMTLYGSTGVVNFSLTPTVGGSSTIYHAGNDSNLAKLDGTQTFSGVNTYSNASAILLNNSCYLRAKDTSGNSRGLLGMFTDNVIYIGNPNNSIGLASPNFILQNNQWIQGKNTADTITDNILGVSSGTDNMTVGSTQFNTNIRFKTTLTCNDGSGPYTIYHTANDSLLEKVYKPLTTTTIKTTSATLTAAEINTKIIRVGTGATANINLTLPTEASMSSYFTDMGDNTTIDVVICNENSTYSGTIVNSDWNEIVGYATIASNSSAKFTLRKVNSTYWVAYRTSG